MSTTNEQLVEEIKAGRNETENMQQLWKQNQNFVRMVALKYQNYAEITDLEQQGYIGLCKAVQHYDSEQGTLFITYFSFWIKQVMQRYISDCCSVVRFPVYAMSEVHRYKKIASEYQREHGKEPSDLEMREFLGVSREKGLF